MPNDGIYVTFIYPARGESRGETIKFSGYRLFLTVHEILTFFGAIKLGRDEKIWIKRKGTDIRHKPYDLGAQLTWEDFSKCTIVIATSYEDALAALSHPQVKPATSLEAQYQKLLDEQQKLWQAKKKAKEERKLKIPKLAAARKKAIRTIVKKKRKARMSEENMKKNNDDTEEV